MEHIRDILKRKAPRINTSPEDTGTWSGTEEPAGESVCPACQGSGFVYAPVPLGHPDFGKAVPCYCTRKESERERQQRLVRYSNLGALTRLTFDNLEPRGRSGDPAHQAQFARAYELAKTFAAEPKGWLVLTGPSGSGKTHLAAAIANEAIRRGSPVFFKSTPDLLDHLRAAYQPESELSYGEFLEQVRQAPVLILDDFGTQSSTPWAKEKLDQILNYRYTNELPTVIVVIVPLNELDERLRSRLTDSRLSTVCTVQETRASAPEYAWGREFQLQRSMTFDRFDWRRVNLPGEQRENLEQAYHLSLEFAKARDGWLVLQGTNGCGKTHLAAAIANYQYQAGKPALFVVVPDFLDHLRSTFSPESKVSYDQLSERVKNTPLLILDDFGEQSTTPWAQEKLYQVINYRYNARLATVITTSLSLEEIETRISSRLVDPKISMVFAITAPDYRGDRLTKDTRPPRRRR
ncbi:MAG: ATP-binding protein [Chloroflexota bacterium]